MVTGGVRIRWTESHKYKENRLAFPKHVIRASYLRTTTTTRAGSVWLLLNALFMNMQGKYSHRRRQQSRFKEKKEQGAERIQSNFIYIDYRKNR